MRLLPACSAALAAALVAPLLVTAPARADASDYVALTGVHQDRYVKGADRIWNIDLDLDPNLDRIDLTVYVGPGPTRPLQAVYDLGHAAADGTCTTDLQVAVDNAQSPIQLRRAEDPAFAPAGSGGGGGSLSGSTTDDRLHRFLPTCGRLTLLDQQGDVVDQRAPDLGHTPIHQLHLGIDSGIAQIPADTATSATFEAHDPRFGYGAVAYDGQAQLSADQGVTLSTTGFTVTDNSTALPTEVTNDPGLHAITASFSGGNVDSSTARAMVYSPGGAYPPATGNLSGRRFADAESSVWFVDRTAAYVGVPHGNARCDGAHAAWTGQSGCLRYAWDEDSNLLRIGDWIGAPDRAATGAHAVRGVFWHRELYCQDWTPARRGLRLQGNWVAPHLFTTYSGVGEKESADGGLTLTKAGRFRIGYASYTEDVTVRGTYRVGKAGRLFLTTSKGKAYVGSLGLAVDGHGRQRPGDGLVVSLGGLLGVHAMFVQGRRSLNLTTTGAASAATTYRVGDFLDAPDRGQTCRTSPFVGR